MMNYQQFVETLSEISQVPSSEIRPEDHLSQHLMLDSLRMVNLLLTLAEKYQLDLSQFRSVGEIETVETLYRALTKGE